MEKGGREVSILTDESESARVKDSLRILPPQTNLAVISLPALLPAKHRSQAIRRGSAGTSPN